MIVLIRYFSFTFNRPIAIDLSDWNVVVDLLKKDLAKPVLSATQTALWKVCDTLGIYPELDNHGDLMRSLSKAKLGGLAGTRKSA